MAMSVTNKSIQNTDGSATHAGKRNFIDVVLLVMSAAMLPYLATLQYGFVYDDDVQVLANPAIRAWHFIPFYFVKSIAGFYSGITSVHYYRPMFFLWLRMNYFLWGTHAWGWHLANLLLHALVSLLVLRVLHKYFLDARWAVAGALIFAVHPAHVETVAWISGATDALMALGLLGSLYLWMRACETLSLWRRIGSLACCGMALLSKETAVILPVLIFVHALAEIPATSLGREASSSRWKFALWEAIPYGGLTVAYLAVRFWVLQGIPSTPQWISRAQTVLTMPSLVLFYASHLLWPVKLSLYYDVPVVSRASSYLFWVPLILVIGVSTGAWIWIRRSGDAKTAAGLWFLLPLAPVLYIQIFQQDDFVHDRYLYLPVLAVAVLAGMLGEFLSKSEMRQKVPSLPLIVLGSTVAALALATVVQVRPWESNLLLYTNATRLAPKNVMARNNLASQYAARGRYIEASDMLKDLLQERPESWLANYNYGFVNYRLGNLVLAEEYLRRAIRIDPVDPDQYVYLGTTYFKEGRMANAADQVRLGIARRPDGTGYHLVMGIIQLQLGNLEAAREEMQQELQHHPESAAARAQLQSINKQTGMVRQ